MDARTLARGLGWFSNGLGLPQVAAPAEFVRLIGIPDDRDKRAIARLVGIREITAGTGLLVQSKPAPWAWARVAGDIMDLGLLGAALTSRRADRGKVAAALAAVLGITAVDLLCATRLGARDGGTQEQPGHVDRAITINRPADEVYRLWRDFRNLPRFMQHLESVQVLDDRRSRWTAKAPAGRSVEWEAEIVEDRPNELIAWRSVDGSSVRNAGSVRFAPAPGDRGTEVRVRLDYDPPAGAVGVAIAKLFGEEPDRQTRDDLYRLKQVIETGEVVRSEGSPDGPRRKQRSAQPLDAANGR